MVRVEPYIENNDTPEDTLDGLGDVPPWALGLGSSTKRRRIMALIVHSPTRHFPVRT